MQIDFSLRREVGHVEITSVANDDPGGLGCPEAARGFPACTATVHYSGHGYRALFGWIQLVRSTDNDSRGAAFEVDPTRVYADLQTPFCWFGFNPTLFDSPWREPAVPMTWLAHCFLCVIPTEPMTRQVRALLGFQLGVPCAC